MKKRLDVLLTERGLASSRERARAYIMEGVVFVNGQREDKPGSFFDPDKIRELIVKTDPIPYVSRGGLKLARALDFFSISVEGLVCLDIGASTGGFTDCLLQNGAGRVYSVDSGTNQLDWKIRSDERVVCMEKTNFRYMSPEDLPEQVDFACADVSFISLTRIIPPAKALLKDHSLMVCLIKPQFEAGRELVGKNGIIRDPAVQQATVDKICSFCGETGFEVIGVTESPIRGAEGNREFLLCIRKRGQEWNGL
ncbi:MAG: TlyA family RNA methyltransferase [Lachnospiraceae bacterium]|nr:TlyA family RNA methyltransferase [Lachnospiraceae bacterium]